MKILHKYILRSFLRPFLSTFLIALFVLIMQAVWLIFDDLAGKGMTISILGKYVFYISIVTVPQAIPIATLLASIMAMGNFSENYEFAAAKSAGVSLGQLLRPLAIFVFFLSLVNLYFLNYAFPWAVMRQKNLYKNIKEHKPALALIEGSFNTEIPGYIIKFDKKYGKEENKLRNVLIYKHKNSKQLESITADNGIILSEEGSRYMTFRLFDGYFYQEHWKIHDPISKRNRMPFSSTHFDQYTVHLDISDFSNEGIDEIKYRSGRDMLSFKQLNIYSDSLKKTYDKYIRNKSGALYKSMKLKPTKHLHPKDSTTQAKAPEKLKMPILENFEPKHQYQVIENALEKFKHSFRNVSNKNSLKYRRKRLNLIDIEFHRRIALSLSALLLFFIGAPLGSLIRKGGFGLPMVISIIVYLVYHFLSEFAKNMAEESSITHILGGWASTLIFLPLAVYLTYRATRDKGAINITPVLNFWKKITDKLKRNR